jgi:ABC-2 type transport system ATP-binding protein
MASVVFESVHKVFGRGGLWPFRSRTPETYALKGISLTVAAGEVLGLLGPNGSGKSTTLKLISTVLLPDRGRVLVRGFDTSRQGGTVRKHVGFVLASERSFFPRLTVRENMEFFAALEDVPRREIPTRVDAVLSEVDLSGSAGKQAMKLSSGMNQRLGIARALIKRPSVLLLDEPTRSLDAATTSEVWKLIRQVADTGCTVLMATHNFEEAIAVCDRIALLDRGKLVEQRPIDGIRSEQLRDFCMEVTRNRNENRLELGVSA